MCSSCFNYLLANACHEARVRSATPIQSAQHTRHPMPLKYRFPLWPLLTNWPPAVGHSPPPDTGLQDQLWVLKSSQIDNGLISDGTPVVTDRDADWLQLRLRMWRYRYTPVAPRHGHSVGPSPRAGIEDVLCTRSQSPSPPRLSRY